MIDLTGFVEAHRLSVREDGGRRGGAFVAGSIEGGLLFGGDGGHPIACGVFSGSGAASGGADDAPARELVREKSLGTAPRPRSHALQQGAGNQEQVAGFERGLQREPHVVPAGEHVVGCLHVGLVRTGYYNETSRARIRIRKGPRGANRFTEAAPVLVVVGPGGVARFVAALKRRIRFARGVAEQFRFGLKTEALPDNLIEIPDELGMDQKVAKRFAQGVRPPQHALRRPAGIDRRIQAGNFSPCQYTSDNKVSADVEAVVFFVAHRVAVHSSFSLKWGLLIRNVPPIFFVPIASVQSFPRRTRPCASEAIP